MVNTFNGSFAVFVQLGILAGAQEIYLPAGTDGLHIAWATPGITLAFEVICGPDSVNYPEDVWWELGHNKSMPITAAAKAAGVEVA